MQTLPKRGRLAAAPHYGKYDANAGISLPHKLSTTCRKQDCFRTKVLLMDPMQLEKILLAVEHEFRGKTDGVSPEDNTTCILCKIFADSIWRLCVCR